MAKTVFGVPGVGNKTEGGGGAIAPGGLPGAKSGGGLPQKSGKDLSPGAGVTPKTSPVATTPRPSKPVSTQANVPKMAKPMGVPVAKPVVKPPSPGGAVAEGKTVFGMPAMKLPETPASQPAIEAPKPVTQPESPKEAAQGVANDAYNATVLGMAAVEPKVNAGEGPGSMPLIEEDRPTTTSNVSSSTKEVEPPQGDFSPSTADIEAAVPQDATSSSRLPDNSIPMWVPAAVLGFIAVVVIVLAVFVIGCS